MPVEVRRGAFVSLAALAPSVWKQTGGWWLRCCVSGVTPSRRCWWPWGGEQDWSAGFMPCWCWPLLAREGSRWGLWPPTRWWQEQGGAAGPEERRTWQVRRSLSNVRRACLSRSGGVRLSPLLRWRRRSGNRRVNGRQHALSASWFRVPHRHAVAGGLGGENRIGALGLCRVGVGRFSRVRAHDGASATNTLVAGAGRGCRA